MAQNYHRALGKLSLTIDRNAIFQKIPINTLSINKFILSLIHI